MHKGIKDILEDVATGKLSAKQAAMEIEALRQQQCAEKAFDETDQPCAKPIVRSMLRESIRIY